MRKHLSWLVLLACAAAVPAQTPWREAEELPPPTPQRDGARPPTPRRDDVRPWPSPLGDVQQGIERLRGERAALHAEHGTAAELALPKPAQDPEASQLRMRLGELLLKFGTRRPPEPPAPPPAAPPDPQPTPKQSDKLPKDPPKKQPPAPLPTDLEAERPIDAAGLGHALFRTGNYEGALAAFRQIKLSGLKAEERMPVQYLIATCLRKLGKHEEAAAAYREVANSRGDEQMAACAQWQLAMMRWRAELEGRLNELRQRRALLEGKQ